MTQFYRQSLDSRNECHSCDLKTVRKCLTSQTHSNNLVKRRIEHCNFNFQTSLAYELTLFHLYNNLWILQCTNYMSPSKITVSFDSQCLNRLND